MSDPVPPPVSTELHDIIQRTLQLLASIVPREIATEALLARPPFRFLHDVIMEVLVVTGFGMDLWDGLEMDALSLRSGEGREGKMRFLTKLIALVCVGKQHLKMPPPFRPAAIVAGQDPELTNILLQVRMHLSFGICGYALFCVFLMGLFV